MSNNLSQKDTHIILLAHGSRDPRWRQPFERLLTALNQQQGFTKISLAYMEMAEPLLESVIHQLINHSDINHFKILPLFLAAGRHWHDDIPQQIKTLLDTYPQITIELQKPIGENEIIQSAITKIVLNLL